MSRCGGRYLCGCGLAFCWWSAFGALWWLISFEMTEAAGHKRNNRFTNWLEVNDEDAA
jgi:hypothetical protein